MFQELISGVENLTPALMVGLGLLLGIAHAFEPDHIASVGTQLIKSKKYSTKNIIKSAFAKSSLIGVFWGAGHTTTIVAIGLLTSFLAISIHDELFSGFELVVGAMLIFLGITTFRNLYNFWKPSGTLFKKNRRRDEQGDKEIQQAHVNYKNNGN